MKKALILSLLSLFLLSNDLFSQNKREKKMQGAIDALMTTEFIQKYSEYKQLVEMTALDFKTQAEYYDQMEVNRISFGYETSRAAFDKILDGLRKDLLDKSTREYIQQNPDRYTHFVTNELEFAMNNYQEQVIYKINELTGNETVGFGIFEIKLFLDLIFDVVGVITSIEKELDKMNEKYLDENFTNPLRVASWEELGNSASSDGSSGYGN